MATVNGYTKEKMDDIVDGVIESGTVNSSGHLILTKHDGSTIDAGSVFPTFAAIAALLYPVGAIYTSVNNTNPGTFLGGTWAAFGSGRVPIGVNGADTRFDVAEETGGTDTITAAMLPQHTHTLGGSTGADAAHTHGVGGSTGAGTAHGHGVGTLTMGGETADHTHGVTQLQKTANASGQSSDNGGGSVTQGTATGRFSAAGNQTASATGGRSAAHAHILSGATADEATHTHTLPANTGAGSSHTHTLPANTGTNAAPTATLLPPYIAVYMWKRTA